MAYFSLGSGGKSHYLRAKTDLLWGALAVERAMEKEDLFYIDDLRDVRYRGRFQHFQQVVCQELKCHRLLEDSTRS